MKICIITFSLGNGGAEKVAAIQSIALQQLGHQVYVVTVVDQIVYPYQGELYNLGKLKSKKNRPWNRFKRFLKLRKYLQANQIDLVIDHRTRKSILQELFLKFFVFGSKVIYVAHTEKLNKNFSKIKNKWLLQMVFGKAAKIVAISKTIQKKIEKQYGFTNVYTLYNPLDQDFKPVISEAVTQLPSYILYYGRIDQEAKDLTFLIEAYLQSNIAKLGVQLYLLGDGPDKPYFEAMVASLNQKENILFLPFTQEPQYFVQHALCTVLTSFYEGLPMTVVESLAMGTPVLCVDHLMGVKEVITHGYNGWLVPKNLNDFSNILLSISQKQARYEWVKQHTVKSVNHLTFQHYVKMLEVLLKTI